MFGKCGHISNLLLIVLNPAKPLTIANQEPAIEVICKPSFVSLL